MRNASKSDLLYHSLHFGVRQYFFSYCYVSISCRFGTAHDSLLCQDDEKKDLVSHSLSDNPVDRFLGWLTDTFWRFLPQGHSPVSCHLAQLTLGLQVFGRRHDVCQFVAHLWE